MSTSADPRAEYRQRLKHRQTTIIGGMVAIMALLMIVCILVWFGVLPVPYDPGFTSAKDEATAVSQPCPPSDATTTDVGAIPVNVYNGTDQAGLATGVADTLTDSGLSVANTTDWPKGTYDGQIELTTSPAGLANAYTLAKVFTGNTVVVQIDETQEATDVTVSVVLGSDYKNEMLTAAEIAQLKPGEPIAAPASCVAVSNAPTAPANNGKG